MTNSDCVSTDRQEIDWEKPLPLELGKNDPRNFRWASTKEPRSKCKCYSSRFKLKKDRMII